MKTLSSSNRNLFKMEMNSRFLTVILAFFITFTAMKSLAQDNLTNSTSSLTLEENIAKPAVSPKAASAVSRYMKSTGNKFAEKELDVSMKRNDQVVMVTLPADRLFAPNSMTLTPKGEALLNYFRQAVEHPELYRVVVAVYADDTGDEEYTTMLTSIRADAIRRVLNAMAPKGKSSPNIDYYWFGPERYIVPNNTIANRAKNRRVEFYIIPENQLIESSRVR